MQTLTAIFIAASSTFNLPPGLLPSLCFVESHHDVKAIHHDDGGTDSLGICQLKLKTAQWMGFRGTERDLMNPKVNIYYSAKYLAYQLDRYEDTTRAVIAYNRGHAGQLTSTIYSDRVMSIWRGEQD